MASGNKPKAKSKTPAKPAPKAKAAPKRTAKAVAKAAPKTAARAKKAARPAKAAKAAKVAPAGSAGGEGESEPTDTELMLQTLACPTATADRLSEICEAAVMGIREDLTGIAASEAVWRDRPAYAGLASAIAGVARALEQHAEILLELYDQLRPIAESEGKHDDLEIAEVVERLRPLLSELSDDADA